jgi:hypothetical protein
MLSIRRKASVAKPGRAIIIGIPQPESDDARRSPLDPGFRALVASTPCNEVDPEIGPSSKSEEIRASLQFLPRS